MQKTITVKVTEYTRHPKYGKDMPSSKKFHARSEELVEEGSTVTIEETRPVSKTVTWKLVSVDKKAAA